MEWVQSIVTVSGRTNGTLPAGTTISMEFTYDNSASNVRNPNVPPRRVVSGNRSSDEMGNLALQIEPLSRDDLTLVREAQWLDMLEDDPEDSAAHFNLGVEYARRGMPAQAATHYERVIRADPIRNRVSAATSFPFAWRRNIARAGSFGLVSTSLS